MSNINNYWATFSLNSDISLGKFTNDICNNDTNLQYIIKRLSNVASNSDLSSIMPSTDANGGSFIVWKLKDEWSRNSNSVQQLTSNSWEQLTDNSNIEHNQGYWIKYSLKEYTKFKPNIGNKLFGLWFESIDSTTINVHYYLNSNPTGMSLNFNPSYLQRLFITFYNKNVRNQSDLANIESTYYTDISNADISNIMLVDYEVNSINYENKITDIVRGGSSNYISLVKDDWTPFFTITGISQQPSDIYQPTLLANFRKSQNPIETNIELIDNIYITNISEAEDTTGIWGEDYGGGGNIIKPPLIPNGVSVLHETAVIFFTN